MNFRHNVYAITLLYIIVMFCKNNVLYVSVMQAVVKVGKMSLYPFCQLLFLVHCYFERSKESSDPFRVGVEVHCMSWFIVYLLRSISFVYSYSSTFCYLSQMSFHLLHLMQVLCYVMLNGLSECS